MFIDFYFAESRRFENGLSEKIIIIGSKKKKCFLVTMKDVRLLILHYQPSFPEVDKFIKEIYSDSG